MENVHFVSLGCPKNLVDSQVMLGSLKAKNYVVVNKPEKASVIIVNTCSFIQAAKEESIDTILEMAQYKDEGSCKALVVSGCMAQRYSEALEKELPEVDLIIGTGQYHRITELLENRDPLSRKTYVNQPAFIHSEKDTRVHTGPKHSAFLKISEGCNRRCSFCIIPKLRGNVRSRTVDSLVKEAEALAKQGVKELCLVAQDLTEYGMEWKYRENLEKLIPALCRVEGIRWIRLHYVYPDQFSDELIDIIAKEDKVVKYLDMPIQHTSDKILKMMNRRLTKERLFRLVEKLRDKIPNIVFRTSIIVGFPGETESDFQELCADLEKLDLDYVGVFRYSKEEDTPAAKLADQIHPSVKRRRDKTLKNILSKLAENKARSYVGKRLKVMIDGPHPETDLLLQARLSTQASEIDGHVLINDLRVSPEEATKLKRGDIVEVLITETSPSHLVASIL